jgi:hypothetical protein
MKRTAKKPERIVFRNENTVQIFRYGVTSNDKIEGDKKRKIVQSYTFSRMQFEMIAQGIDITARDFFSVADSNCLDCPFNEYGKCYTHKAMQYSGFLSMLKSVCKEYSEFYLIPEYSDKVKSDVEQMSEGTYVRFGTYGEPSVHPLELIEAAVAVCDTYTGYTHQWSKKPELGRFFMASTHDAQSEQIARQNGFRSFIATVAPIDGAVNCPASKEAGYKSTCSKCALCSGTEGKGKKSIYILLH